MARLIAYVLTLSSGNGSEVGKGGVSVGNLVGDTACTAPVGASLSALLSFLTGRGLVSHWALHLAGLLGSRWLTSLGVAGAPTRDFSLVSGR